MNVLHGEASRADYYEKHTGTDSSESVFGVRDELSSRAVTSQVLSP